MALYVSEARRARRTFIIAVCVGVSALVIGWAVGRQQVPNITERVSEVRSDAKRIAAALERLDIEYEQVLAGKDSLQAGVLDPVASDVRTPLQRTLDRAPWVTAAQRASVLDVLAAVESAAKRKVSVDEFRTALRAGGQQIRTLAGA